MASFFKSKDYDSYLRVLEKDAGILLSSHHPKQVLKSIDDCPKYILKAHPSAMLVLMRRMFTWRNIPKVFELKELLLSSIK